MRFRLFTHLVAATVLVTAATVARSNTVAPSNNETSVFDFSFTSIDGKPMPLKSFAGRVLLIVNTASFCGYTPQYRGLQSLAEKYESRGLTVIGVPSNDFGRQEPKSESEIKTFCQGAFGVTFPLTQKQVVVGDGAHPFYKWAAAVLGKASVPAWNFHKYLVGRDGHLIGFFGSSVIPERDELQSAITTALAKTSPAL